MLHSSKSLRLPHYTTLEHLEGKGNYAVKRYYQFPFSWFYKKKLKMIVELLGDKKYYNILDYGCGSGIFLTELQRHAQRVVGYDVGDPFNPAWKFDVIVLGSVLEFTNVQYVLNQVKSILKPGGLIVGASPMTTALSQAYFKLIGDTNYRHKHLHIQRVLMENFPQVKFKEWMGLYFSFRATV